MRPVDSHGGDEVAVAAHGGELGGCSSSSTGPSATQAPAFALALALPLALCLPFALGSVFVGAFADVF